MAYHGYITNKTRQRIISSQQTSGFPLPLDRLLAVELDAARIIARTCPTPERLARVAELEEHELILIAIKYGYGCFKPAPGCGRAK